MTKQMTPILIVFISSKNTHTPTKWKEKHTHIFLVNTIRIDNTTKQIKMKSKTKRKTYTKQNNFKLIFEWKMVWKTHKIKRKTKNQKKLMKKQMKNYKY